MSGRKILRRFSSSISDLLSLQKKSECDDDRECATPLHQAVRMGSTVMAKNVLDNKLAWVDEEDGKGRTALHYAIEQSSYDLASLLLEAGANPDCVDFSGLSACHLAAKDGFIDLFDLLVYYKCDMCAIDKSGKTPFDIACEFGREKMVERFVESGIPMSSLMNAGVSHTAKALHLAARMGHVNVVSQLLSYGWSINTTSPNGSTLHEAASHGRVQVLRFLLHAGIDSKLENSGGQNALEVAKKNQNKNPITYKEIRFLLKEHKNFAYAEAICEFSGLHADELSFNKGDLIWVTDRSCPSGPQQEARWRGIIFGQKGNSRAGYFSPATVRCIDRPSAVISMSGRVAGPTALPTPPNTQRMAKKVSIPIVPNMAVACSRPDELQTFSTPMTQRSQTSRMSEDRHSDLQNNNRIRPGGLDSFHYTGFNGCMAPKAGMSLTCSPSTVDPSHRNSTGSSSSQGSSGFESMKSITALPTTSSSTSFHQPNTPQSTIDSPPSRISIHSSGSGGSGHGSLASCSVDTFDDSTYGSFSENPINVTSMVAKGVPEAEILALWLERMGMSEYLTMFLTQGYDLSSIARITPEDLNALGITSPAHRKRLVQEIHAWHITDSWPCVPPNGGLREWLTILALPEYYEIFVQQGYETVQEVMKLTWEDFEDIGIKRLGHLKRLGLAIKKLKDFRRPTIQSVEPSIGVPTHPVISQGARSRASDPPPPAPASTFHSKPTTSMNLENIDYISYARGSKNPPPPPVRGHIEEYPSLSTPRRGAAYDPLFDTREPIRLNLHPTGKILSEAARNGNHEFLGPLPPGADCPPPPAPLFSEASLRRLQSAVTSEPSQSDSSTSLEQLPFANENCGTIRQRDHPNSARAAMKTSNSGMETLSARSDPSTKPNVLNDIGFMLQNLTDELDAMLGGTQKTNPPIQATVNPIPK